MNKMYYSFVSFFGSVLVWAISRLVCKFVLKSDSAGSHDENADFQCQPARLTASNTSLCQGMMNFTSSSQNTSKTVLEVVALSSIYYLAPASYIINWKLRL